jgi:hypothetical protein
MNYPNQMQMMSAPQFVPFYPRTSSLPMTFNRGVPQMSPSLRGGGINMQTPQYIQNQSNMGLQSVFTQETPKQTFQQNMQNYAVRQQQQRQQQILQNERNFKFLLIKSHCY